MSLTATQIEELAMVLPQLWSLYGAITAGVKAMPPTASRKPSDWTSLAVAVLPQIGAIADTIEADVKPAAAALPAK